MPKNIEPGSAPQASGSRGRNRRLSIRSELRREPDVRKIARAVVALAMAEAERAAEADRLAKGQSPEEDAS